MGGAYTEQEFAVVETSIHLTVKCTVEEGTERGADKSTIIVSRNTYQFAEPGQSSSAWCTCWSEEILAKFFERFDDLAGFLSVSAGEGGKIIFALKIREVRLNKRADTRIHLLTCLAASVDHVRSFLLRPSSKLNKIEFDERT